MPALEPVTADHPFRQSNSASNHLPHVARSVLTSVIQEAHPTVGHGWCGPEMAFLRADGFSEGAQTLKSE